MRVCTFAILLLAVQFSFATSYASEEHLVRAHSHNDYEQHHPLYDALDQNFYSVEADIWLRGGNILISHLGWTFKGSLDGLYLDPLQKIIDRQGSVHGDGTSPFYIWLDIKDGSAALRAKLHKMLNRYSMFTTFGGTNPSQGPVTAILTGNVESKIKFVEEYPVRKASRQQRA